MQLTPIQVFLVYLPYGAVFFAIGVAITSRRKNFLNLKIAGLFWLLAIFAFVHALHEWMEMFRHLQLATDPTVRTLVRHVSLLLALSSFLFLFLFGTSLVAASRIKAKPWLHLLFGTVSTLFLIHLLMQHPWQDPMLLRTIEYDMRLLIALPSTLLTAFGFLLYARQLKIQKIRGALSFQGAGCAFIAYGIFAGAIPSGTILILPVEVLRALSAFVILHFLMHALDTFMDEQQSLITKRLQLAGNSEKLSAIGRLAAGIAHEINNPLANASLQLELLHQHPDIQSSSEKTHKRLGIIAKSIDRSSHIARELLSFAGDRFVAVEPSAVVLEDAIQSAWELASYRTKNHQLECRLPALPAISGQRVKLEELFLNLLVNAIDAMPGGGTITCTGQIDSKQVIIELTDEGVGIPDENRDRVMEPFFTTKEVGQGTGLGLSICYGIMQAHGGTIAIGPRQDALGTKVRLTFPL